MSAEWIKYEKTWEQFCDAGLNKPGTQINIKQDLKGHYTYIIGDIDSDGHYSDDDGGGCCGGGGVSDHDFILRYRVLEIEND